ncbi:MAG: hybrid sensor histidine kinase/response regulator [Anaerolineae bacterium]|nr:hybrid sensor histidine kinase/response regulator [Anaerolineae bacterium]
MSDPNGQQQTILYIEDDLSSQILVQRLLTFAGYRVLVASSGLGGIDTARASRPDLILMDINLPDLSGREVTTRLRALEEFRAVPIVALTAQSQLGEREKAMAAGLDGYLTKPIDVDALPEQVAAYLLGKRDEVDPAALEEARTAYSQEIVTRLESKIRELETAYKDLQRLDSMKEAFIQLTAHELRTPLTLIYGYGQLLQNSPIVARMMLESDEVANLITNLLEAIERMSSVINEILLVSRVASGRVELTISALSPASLVEDVVENFRRASETRHVTLQTDLEQAPQRLYADRDLLKLALGNLIGNAIKYTPDGGTVTVRVSAHNERALLMVQDTGIGINKDDQQLVFERFYTVGDMALHSTSKVAFRGGGLGLGLAVTREIVRAHSGDIWVDSPGRDEEKLPGSAFTVAIPLKGRLASPIRRPGVS